MPRRITATEKWADPWFRRLKPAQKLLWLWMLDQCDLAGTFEIDEEKALFEIGAKVSLDPSFEGRVVKISDTRYCIPKFIDYQQARSYSELNQDNKAHQAIIKLVEKYAISDIVTGIGKGSVRDTSLTCIGIGIGKGEGRVATAFVAPTLAEVEAYMEGQMPAVAKRCPGALKIVFPKQEAPKFFTYWHERDWLVKGKKMKSWQQAAYNWLIKSYQYTQERAR